MFVDIAKIKIKGGDGGDGVISFYREKYKPAGGPDGGNGGKGGDILFVVDDNLSTLADFRYKRKYIGNDGKPGAGKNCSGRSGEDTVIRVPRGTLIKDASNSKVIYDLSGDDPVVIAKGGKGGKGNANFATPTRQIPRFSKPGYPGQELEILLELKLLADVGLVGFPNVGKSTFLSVVSHAKPKIANYHFTTLTPVLGVVEVEAEKSFVIADIPGLIEGASDGVGLGYSFLRHIERCRLIVHIVDVSGCEGRDPVSDYELINLELKNFNEEISSRPQIVLGNKMDIADEEKVDEFKEYLSSKNISFLPISAATKSGIKSAIFNIYDLVKSLPPIKEYEIEYKPFETLDLEYNKFDIEKDNDLFIINAEFLKGVMRNIDMDDYESLRYFQKVLKMSGIIAELENQGINEGDTIRIFDLEFEYIR